MFHIISNIFLVIKPKYIKKRVFIYQNDTIRNVIYSKTNDEFENKKERVRILNWNN